MNKKNRILAQNLFLVFLPLTLACAEKKTRLWIEPPVGMEVSERTSGKLYYQVEDIQSGKKENLVIPINQPPENLVVEKNGNKAQSDVELALATKADQQISLGKLPEPGSESAPTISYLRSLAEVEDLYQKRQFSEALVRLAPLVEQYPNQSRLFVMQGTLFRRIGERKLALDAYKRAQKLEKNNPKIEEAVLRSQEEVGENI